MKRYRYGQSKPYPYRRRLRRRADQISEIFHAETGTPEGDERDVLVDLIECYEDRHYPIGPPTDPIASIEFEVDQVVMHEGAKLGETNGWREVAVGEIAEIFDGPHATPKKTDSGPVFLGISNLVNGRIDLSTTRHLSEDDYKTWTKRVTPVPGDVVFSYETRLGEVAAIPQGLRCCLGRRMGLLRPRKELVDADFLLYAYLGPRFQQTLQARTVQGSTVDRILLSELGSFPLEIPIEVSEQRAIAHILGTLDDKIELNRRMNQTLEEMARAIFKDWFIDFGPCGL